MSILILDTETTGRDPAKARLVQLAALHIEGQEPYRTLAELNVIIQPAGFDIPVEAAAIHGIDTARAQRQGIQLYEALDRLRELCEAAGENMMAGRLVAHNVRYDTMVLLGELQRMGGDVALLGTLRPFCTMTAMTERCAIPGRYGKYKWPRLSEAYVYCFNQLPDEDDRGHAAHSAMGDVLSCRDIFLHGIAQGWWR